MSPTSSAPCGNGGAIAGWSLATPGLIAIRSAPRERRVGERPGFERTLGSSAASAARFGGSARVSATRTSRAVPHEIARERQAGEPEPQHDGARPR